MPTYSFQDLDDPDSQLTTDLTKAHRSAILYAWRRYGSRTEAEDAAQGAVESFLEALNRADEKFVHDLTAYVVQSARRNCIRAISAPGQKRAPRIYTELMELMADEASDPQRSTSLLQSLETILTNRELVILIMHEVDRYTYKEIADLTAYGGVKSIGNWARAAVKKLHDHREELGV